MPRGSVSTVILSSIALTGVATSLRAETDEGHVDRLDEIVVTAQKRAQSINDVGMTIQSLTSDMLAQRGVSSPADLAKFVAGFSYTQSLFSTPVYTLRGIGLYDAGFTSVPAVAIYTDQVPRDFPILSDALNLDIERVEVLKGPQGTLFGQSATGGAINYIVAKPTDAFAAGVDVSYDLRFGKQEISAFVSGPITDTLKARLAVRADQGGAWQYSESRPTDTNGETRDHMLRLTVDWAPISALRVEASVTGDRDHSDSQAPQYIYTPLNYYSAAALAAADANPATRNPYGIVNNTIYAGLTTPGSANYDSTFLGRQATAVGRLNGLNPAAAAGAAALLGTPNVVGNARAADWTQGLLRPADNNYFQGTLRVDYDILSNLTITSVTAYANKSLNYAIDDDGTAAAVVDIPVFGSVRAVDEELRISGKGDAYSWMIGGDYDDSRSVQDNYYGLSSYTANNPIPGIAPITLGQNNFETTLRTYAAFANVDYAFTKALSINGGVRFTQNNQNASYCYNDPAKDVAQTEAAAFSALQNIFTGQALAPIGPGQCFVLGDGFNGTTFGKATLAPLLRSQDQNNVSYRVGLDYKFESGTLVYATVSRGYKAGVFSDIGAASTSQYAPAVQEKVIAYEAGLKAPLFDRRLQFNAAYFYYAYTDKQVRGKVLDPVFGLNDKMINVPKSYVWGLEGEIQARPVNGLTLSASATYLKSEVTSKFATTSDGIPAYNANQYTGDFKGSALPYTPKYSANADAQYEWRMGSNLAPFIGGNVLFQGSQNTTYANNVLLVGPFHINSYTTTDFRLGIGSTDTRWQVYLFDRNAFNRVYTTSVTTFLDTVFRLTGLPNTYGVAARFRFQ